MTTMTSNGDIISELSEPPHPALQSQRTHDDCGLDGNEINLVLSKHHPDTKDTKAKYLFSWYNFIKYSRVYSRYQICLSKIRLGIIPILFKCQNSCKQQFQIKYHSNETKTSFALWAVTPSHVIWWLVTNWKRRLNILNEVNQHFIILHFTQGLLYIFQKIPHLSDPDYWSISCVFLISTDIFYCNGFIFKWCSHKWMIG